MGRRQLVRAFGVVVVLGACSGHALAEGAPPEKATATARAAAQKAYVRGADAFKNGRFADALAAFRESYATVASPNSHLMLARSLRDLGDRLGAYAEYERLVPEAEAAAAREAKYAASAEAAKRELAEVRAKLALVTIDVANASGSAVVTAGGKPIDAASLGKPIAMLPGAVELDATAGGVAKHESLTLAAGDVKTVRFDLASPPGPAPAAAPPEPSVAVVPPGESRPRTPNAPPPDSTGSGARTMRTLAYVSAGVGVAGLATFALFGAMNQSKFHSLEDACANGHCPPDNQDDIDAGRRYQTIANVGLGVGLLGVATGAALFLGSNADGAPPQVSTGKPLVVFAPGSVHVEGRF